MSTSLPIYIWRDSEAASLGWLSDIGTATPAWVGFKRRRINDNRERLTQIVNPAGGQTQFAYNARGDVTNLTDPDNNVSFFYWDANRRLTQEYRPSVATYAERKA